MHFDENNECILTFSVDWVLTLETFSEVVYQILYVHTKLLPIQFRIPSLSGHMIHAECRYTHLVQCVMYELGYFK